MKILKSFSLMTLLFSIPVFSQTTGIVWEKTFGGGGYEVPRDIILTIDGGCIVTGFTNSSDGDISDSYGGFDFWVIKLDSAGALQWEKSFGGSSHEDSSKIYPTPDGGFILTGYTLSTDGDISENDGGYDVWIVKLNSSGNLEWERTFGGSGFNAAYDIAFSAFENRYIIAAESTSADGDVSVSQGGRDIWIINMTTDGNIHWEKSIGGSADEYVSSIAVTPDDYYIIAGTTYSDDGDITENKGGSDIWIVKMDPNTGITWQKTYGGSADDSVSKVYPTTDGGYIIVGMTSSEDGDAIGNLGEDNGWIIKTDGLGIIQWQQAYGGSDYDSLTDIFLTSDGGYWVAGTTGSSDGNSPGTNGEDDFWILKIDNTGNILESQTFGGSETEGISRLAKISDSEFYAAGSTHSDNGDVTGFQGGLADFWIVKFGETLSVSDFHSSEITIYPNPASEMVFIQSEENICQIRLMTITGQNVVHMQGQNISSVDIAGLSSGIYVIDVQTQSGKNYNRHLIIK